VEPQEQSWKEIWEGIVRAMRIPVMILFALGCFGLLLFLWISFGGPSPLRAKKYELRVNFPDATSLAEAADVRIAGVTVGKVGKKNLDKGGSRTRATLFINRRYAPLPRDTHAILREKTLLGETFVELTPGHPSSGDLPDKSILPNAQVAPTVQLDEILRTFDPQTKAAFQNWVRSSALQIKGSAPQDFNDALGNLAGFAQDGAGVLRVLDDQHAAVRQLVRNTGIVFGALNERRGQLRDLIVNSQRTFSATAAEQDALATTFAIFPTFLDESRLTAARLERFSVNTRPLVDELKPVADNLGPTVRDLSSLSPDLVTLFTHLKPVIAAAPRTLPQASRFLKGARPVLEALHPFLQELNPIVSFVNYDQQSVANFISEAAAALNYRINGEPNTHMLPQLGIISPNQSLSFNSRSVPTWARGGAYPAPNARDRAMPLGVIESFDCHDTGQPGLGTKRNPTDHTEDPEGFDQPPCFTQPKFLYDDKFFPFLEHGEVYTKPPPTNSLRGRWPANPNTHP
jgi:phospholipid/cholesterol/gamma-HCH transport system substrate-binding protein